VDGCRDHRQVLDGESTRLRVSVGRRSPWTVDRRSRSRRLECDATPISCSVTRLFACLRPSVRFGRRFGAVCCFLFPCSKLGCLDAFNVGGSLCSNLIHSSHNLEHSLKPLFQKGGLGDSLRFNPPVGGYRPGEGLCVAGLPLLAGASHHNSQPLGLPAFGPYQFTVGLPRNFFADAEPRGVPSFDAERRACCPE
jgi:hypothetical protein